MHCQSCHPLPHTRELDTDSQASSNTNPSSTTHQTQDQAPSKTKADPEESPETFLQKYTANVKQQHQHHGQQQPPQHLPPLPPRFSGGVAGGTASSSSSVGSSLAGARSLATTHQQQSAAAPRTSAFVPFSQHQQEYNGLYGHMEKYKAPPHQGSNGSLNSIGSSSLAAGYHQLSGQHPPPPGMPPGSGPLAGGSAGFAWTRASAPSQQQQSSMFVMPPQHQPWSQVGSWTRLRFQR